MRTTTPYPAGSGVPGGPSPAPGPRAAPGSPPPGYPAAPVPYPAYAPAPVATGNSNATMSLVFGLIGWFVCPILSIFAITYGRRAQTEIAASGGMQTGDAMAKAGIILGWIVVAIYGLFLVGGALTLIIVAIAGLAAA